MPNKKHPNYPDIKSKFSDNAISIMENHYFLKDKNGKQLEKTPEETFKRICNFYHRNGVDTEKCKKLYEYLMMQFVTFNSPLFYNVTDEKNTAQIFACFMSEFDDSMDGITRELSKAAKIFQKGAGVGLNYSDLRPRGASIGDGAKTISKDTGSSGPVSFLTLFNKTGDVVKSSGKRRAAHLATLRCDHPDIEDFIDCKSDPKRRSDFVNANLSVYITDEFMLKVDNDEEMDLVWHGVNYGKVKAKEIFGKICTGAKTCGDPGILFGDRAQEYNTIAFYNGKEFIFKTSNPCGEILGYAPYFSCVLGHINLYKVYLDCKENGLNFIDRIGDLAKFLSDFLDVNLDLNEYPHSDFEEGTKATRPIGLGIMGFGELLMAMGVRYGSGHSIKLAEEIAEQLTLSALERSNESGNSYPLLSEKTNRERLVNVLGKYRDKSGDQKDRWEVLIKKIKDGGHCRNCAVTTVAPTGTTGIVADAGTGGIEPQFALYYKRNVVGQDKPLEIVDSELKKYMDENNIDSVDDIDILPDYFVSAHDIDPLSRIKVQGAFQKFIMFGVSSTINLSSSTTTEDIDDIYREAHKHGLKGITIFVDGCLKNFGGSQVLEIEDVDTSEVEKEINIEDKDIKEQNRILKITLTKTKQKVKHVEDRLRKLKEGFDRPINIKSETFSFKLTHSNGVHEFLVTVGEMEGRPIEVIITLGKSGTEEHAWSEAVGRLISMALQAEIPLNRLCRKIRNIKGDLASFAKFRNEQEKPFMVYSIPDLIAKLLEYIYVKDAIYIDGAQECPSCRNMTFVHEGGCMICKNDKCKYEGSCG